MDRLLASEEPESSRLIESVLANEGIEVRTGTEAAGLEVEGDSIKMRYQGDPDRAAGWSGSHVLVAAGRSPRTAELGLDSVSVELDKDGSIRVDQRMRTSARGIFAVGDVTGTMAFTHVAAQQARVAAPNALFGLRGRADYSAVPWATFTDPEIARVGISEAEARELWGGRTQVAQFDYADLDRAMIEGRTGGFAKLIAGRRGRLTGATIAGHGAGDAIAEMAAWINRGARIDDLSKQVHTYPTMAEGASRAADAYVTERFMTPRNRVLLKPLLGITRLLHRFPGGR